MCTQINNTCLAFMLQSKAVTCPCETPFGKTRSSFGGNVPNCTESPCVATFFFFHFYDLLCENPGILTDSDQF